MEKGFIEQLNDLYEQSRILIREKVNSVGIESKFLSGLKVIEIKEPNLQFNLDSNRKLAEIATDIMIDDEGYHYNYSVLDYDDLFELVDYLKNNY